MPLRLCYWWIQESGDIYIYSLRGGGARALLHGVVAPCYQAPHNKGATTPHKSLSS